MAPLLPLTILLLLLLSLLQPWPNLRLAYRLLRQPRSSSCPALFDQSVALCLITTGLLAPLCCLSLNLLLVTDNPEDRLALCSVFIKAKFFFGELYFVTLFFSFVFRTFLILYSDRGLVKNGKPNLLLFNQLFWTILITFFVIMYISFPLHAQFLGTFPQISKQGRLCLHLSSDEDVQYKHENLKIKLIGLAFPCLAQFFNSFLKGKCERYLANLCPKRRMSCLGLYQRNVISFEKTSRLIFHMTMYSLIDNGFLVAVTGLALEPRLAFHLHSTLWIAFYGVYFALVLPSRCTAPELRRPSPARSCNEFYVKEPKILEPRRPQESLASPVWRKTGRKTIFVSSLPTIEEIPRTLIY